MKVERCPVCKRKVTRSNEANRRYWLLLHEIADKVKPSGVDYSAETFHLYFKSRFLGCDDFTLPNGKTVSLPKSSARLEVPEFSAFMEQVEAWAAERGVYLADLEGT